MGSSQKLVFTGSGHIGPGLFSRSIHLRDISRVDIAGDRLIYLIIIKYFGNL